MGHEERWMSRVSKRCGEKTRFTLAEISRWWENVVQPLPVFGLFYKRKLPWRCVPSSLAVNAFYLSLPGTEPQTHSSMTPPSRRETRASRVRPSSQHASRSRLSRSKPASSSQSPLEADSPPRRGSRVTRPRRSHSRLDSDDDDRDEEQDRDDADSSVESPPKRRRKFNYRSERGSARIVESSSDDDDDDDDEEDDGEDDGGRVVIMKRRPQSNDMDDNDDDDDNEAKVRKLPLKKPAHVKAGQKATGRPKATRRLVQTSDNSSDDGSSSRQPAERTGRGRAANRNDASSSDQGDESSDESSEELGSEDRRRIAAKKPVGSAKSGKPVSSSGQISKGTRKAHSNAQSAASPARSDDQSNDDDDEEDEDEESWMGDTSNKKGGSERLTSRQRAMQGEAVELEFTKLDSPKSKKKGLTEEFDNDEENELKKQQKARLRQMIHEKRNKEKRAAMVDRVLRGVTSKRKKTTMASEAHAAQVGSRLSQNEAREGCLRILSSAEGSTVSLPKDVEEDSAYMDSDEVWYLQQASKAKYPPKCKRDPKTGKRIFAH